MWGFLRVVDIKDQKLNLHNFVSMQSLFLTVVFQISLTTRAHESERTGSALPAAASMSSRDKVLKIMVVAKYYVVLSESVKRSSVIYFLFYNLCLRLSVVDGLWKPFSCWKSSFDQHTRLPDYWATKIALSLLKALIWVAYTHLAPKWLPRTASYWPKNLRLSAFNNQILVEIKLQKESFASPLL